MHSVFIYHLEKKKNSVIIFNQYRKRLRANIKIIWEDNWGFYYYYYYLVFLTVPLIAIMSGSSFSTLKYSTPLLFWHQQLTLSVYIRSLWSLMLPMQILNPEPKLGQVRGGCSYRVLEKSLWGTSSISQIV